MWNICCRCQIGKLAEDCAEIGYFKVLNDEISKMRINKK
jgi:hypothetical protein